MTSKVKSSSSFDVANVVLKACESEKPKTRYLVGFDAKLLVYLRKTFSDRFFDKLLEVFLK